MPPKLSKEEIKKLDTKLCILGIFVGIIVLGVFLGTLL